MYKVYLLNNHNFKNLYQDKRSQSLGQLKTKETIEEEWESLKGAVILTNSHEILDKKNRSINCYFNWLWEFACWCLNKFSRAFWNKWMGGPFRIVHWFINIYFPLNIAEIFIHITNLNKHLFIVDNLYILQKPTKNLVQLFPLFNSSFTAYTYRYIGAYKLCNCVITNRKIIEHINFWSRYITKYLTATHINNFISLLPPKSIPL